MKLVRESLIAFVLALAAASAHAQIADDLSDLGVNHETQVAAACAEQYGVNYAGGACIVGALTAEEIEKCFSDGFGGEGCFGDNNTFVHIVEGNLDAAAREDGDVNQVIRATTGISVEDIEDDGILGGDNSEARKACNAVAGIFGGSC